MDDGKMIAEAIFSGCCVAVSDSSNKDGIGTASWVLECLDSKHWISGLCIVPGSSDDQSAPRSEHAGLYALV
jgi:hypothetical protein